MASNSTPHRTPGTGRPRGRPRGSRTRHSFTTPGTVHRVRSSGTTQRSSRPSRSQPAAAADPGAYKPREERSYTEFYPDFDITADITAYDSREIDGAPNGQLPPLNNASVPPSTPGKANGIRIQVEEAQDQPEDAAVPLPSTNGGVSEDVNTNEPNGTAAPALTRQQSSKGDDDSQSSHGAHDAPVVSTPTRRSSRQKDNKEKASFTPKTATRPVLPMSNIHHNERLSLPVPSYKAITPFQLAETYVDRAMAGVGFQESDYWQRPHTMVRNIGIQDTIHEGEARITSAIDDKEESNNTPHTVTPGMVEYDMDEQDDKWLTQFNILRRSQDVPTITREIFEITITKIEREWYALEKMIPKQSAHAAHVKRGNDDDEEDTSEDSKCQICDDGECENSNAIVFCDGCNIAVHQDCYGVPFIPEGQWLCRRCSLLAPRREVNCIFCPNTDGAFKMTDSSLWSHLLCAIWIPEVTISNMVYMEPVEGIDLVPKSRWKLHCYICKQRMGACIQCSNKSCYLAFHVTCARKAKLFLSMRQQIPTDPAGGTAVGAERSLIFDGSQLKAFCDKHVPSEWRKEYRTDIAIRNVQHYYEDLFYEKDWGDSQMKALTPGYDHTSTVPKLTLTVGGKRKRPSAGSTGTKTVWRLPSGAPIIPQVLYNTIIEAISRFAIRKPKEYVAEICKYWTLKREARRDASLLKRLQVSISSSFTSDEVTKKDYSAYYDGEEKLKRRLDFAIKLRHDLERIRLLADDIKKREKEKLRQAECLKEMIDAVYFPLVPVLTPILERAQQLDSKDFFKTEFNQIKQKLVDRGYNNVSQFSRDILSVLTSVVTSRSKFAVTNNNNNNNNTNHTAITADTNDIIPETPAPGTSTAAATPAAVVTANPMDSIPLPPKPAGKALGDTAGKTAGRILRVLQPMLENARLQEQAMREDPNERMAGEVDERYKEILKKRDEEVNHPVTTDIDGNEVDRMDIDEDQLHEGLEVVNTNLLSGNKEEEGEVVLGIPWYTKPFSPLGATLLAEERWMGMDVVRDMSPLSELDEEEVEMLQRSETPEEGEEIVVNGDDHSSSNSGKKKSNGGGGGGNGNGNSVPWIPGTRASTRQGKGVKRVSYIEPQPPVTPVLKKEVGLEQVVVIGSTRSQTKQARDKASRRGRGYVWVEVEEDASTKDTNTQEENGVEEEEEEAEGGEEDKMEIDSEVINTTTAAATTVQTVGMLDEEGSVDSPLTEVPDDPEDGLSLDSLDLNLLGKDIKEGDNMETENEGTEFHTPLEATADEKDNDVENGMVDDEGVGEQLSKELAAAAASQELQQEVVSPGKRSTRSSPRQKDNNLVEFAGSPEGKVSRPGSKNGRSTPKKSPPVFTPAPMTTRSRKVLEETPRTGGRAAGRKR